MTPFELAQLNIARPLAPLESPRLADFVANLDRINALAEAAPGFVWRLQTEDGNATPLRPFDARTIVNLSVWRDVESLRAFAFRGEHADFLKRRREWFEPAAEASGVLWWVPAGHRPTLDEAAERLARLRRLGAHPAAFTFARLFSPSAAPA